MVSEIRQSFKLTQVKLVTMLEVSLHTINRWENGQTRPSPLAMKQIKQLLHQMAEPGEAFLAKYFQK
ncbi:MAG: helix-turn-helix transcriptional regulator [Nostoc sp.]|uniref:helix-turn-helix domain-containing protein n=1 Tax=Nostoc sp. TaxID=1180 RepID=UPI002FFADFF0